MSRAPGCPWGCTGLGRASAWCEVRGVVRGVVRAGATGGSRALGPQGVGSSWPCAAQDLRALEGSRSRPGEEGLISRSEIKARSPPQAAPSNSAARGGRSPVARANSADISPVCEWKLRAKQYS
jgi:hypothetical protein